MPRAASRGPRLNALEEADELEEEEDGEEGELRGEDGGGTEDKRTDDIHPVEEVRLNEHLIYHDLALYIKSDTSLAQWSIQQNSTKFFTHSNYYSRGQS